MVNTVLGELKVEGATMARVVHGQNSKVAAFLGLTPLMGIVMRITMPVRHVALIHSVR